MKSERTHRRLYLLECLLLGPPALIVSGLLIGFVLVMAVADPGFEHDNQSLKALAWSVMGLAGAIAWLWLSWRYLRWGRSALQEAPAFPWLMLLFGVVAALPMLAVSITVLLAEAHGLMRGSAFRLPHWQTLCLPLAGPPLLLPAAHLAWLRRRQRLAA
ncbi:TPA: hypothetical protein QDZ42_000187 [Stenotrophomonas maltophilia]|nr:hypothetical protein [Stenotrophomonas maltophilia]HDS1041593.1 hypothetical protein [Stenotrophomonas maltophilia]